MREKVIDDEYYLKYAVYYLKKIFFNEGKIPVIYIHLDETNKKTFE